MGDQGEKASDQGQSVSNRPAPISYGAFVGFSFEEFGQRLVLNLQTLKSTRADSPGDIDSHYFVMSRRQAAILADRLYRATGESRPARPRRKLLGGLF